MTTAGFEALAAGLTGTLLTPGQAGASSAIGFQDATYNLLVGA